VGPIVSNSDRKKTPGTTTVMMMAAPAPSASVCHRTRRLAGLLKSAFLAVHVDYFVVVSSTLAGN
jgi:hypothetical protein